jgi:hypothetical protein
MREEIYELVEKEKQQDIINNSDNDTEIEDV